ncbi:MAG: hypothetical protein RLZZ337_723 [Bacteroidota bacterium]|jgi:hypothetical protein
MLAKHKQQDKSERLTSFKSIMNVGIVYDAKKISPIFLNRVTGFFEAEGKSVCTLGFVNEKELGEYLPTLREEFFCKKDLTFWKIPKKDGIHKFITTPFDYLINLDSEGSVELQSISTFSNAKTRIGKYFEEFPFAQDFMVKSLAETEEELFNDITKYIK